MKRFLSIILTLITLLSAIYAPTAVGAAGVTLTRGDIIELGSYPQTEVTDAELIAALDGISADWISYGYFVDGELSDYMQYKDAEYNGVRYRAVTFSSAVNTYQTRNGYNTDTVYWFRYEPLQWKVLDAGAGLVTCDIIIDSRQFYRYGYSNTETRGGEECYANSYRHSDIRAFLTDDFYNLAFTADEKAVIVPATVNSDDYSAGNAAGNGDVADSVFLLSYTDVLNADYGFSPSGSENDTARRAQGTDYAKCQGLYVEPSGTYAGNSYWRLRSAGNEGYNTCQVNYRGYVGAGCSVSSTYYGVRPALKLNLESPALGCVLYGAHTEGEETLYKAPTCTEDGYDGYICSACGARIITEALPATGHGFENGRCINCGLTVLTRGEIIEFGSYPQTEVTDSALIAALDGVSAEWVSYEYYYTLDETSDAMSYKDVEYNGEKYRAVTFSSVRPEFVGATHSYQTENGYDANATYWFKFEPLQWRVLDPDEALVTCESIIDAHQFYREEYSDTKTRDGEECRANSYNHSDIRAFLTDTFYNLAFTTGEKAVIVPATVSGNGYTAKHAAGNADVTDSVFLLGWEDVLSEDCGFNPSYSNRDIARRAQGTDYAKCQGLYVYPSSDEYDGNSFWWLRSAGYNGYHACCVSYFGTPNYDYYVGYTKYGVRPALKLNLQSDELGCAIGKHVVDGGNVTTAPACATAGVKTYSCVFCGEVLRTEAVEALGHDYENGVCARCGANVSDAAPGDVNLDGKVNSADVNLLLKFISGTAEPANETASQNADVSGDGKVSAADVNLIIRSISGL